MKHKMHLDNVLIAGFNFQQRKIISGYIRGPLCNMAGLKNEMYFRDEILSVLPGRLMLTYDTIYIYGYNLKVEDIKKLLARALTKANVTKSVMVRMYAVGANGEHALVFNQSIKAIQQAA